MARPRLPWMKFYPRDWLNEPSLRLASHEAKGVWIDLICLAWDSPVRGKILGPNGDALTHDDIARIIGIEREKCEKILAELDKLGVSSHDEKGCIYCRRMLREDKRMEQDRRRAKRYYHGSSAGDSHASSNGGEVRSQKSEVRNQKTNEEQAPPATKRTAQPLIVPDRENTAWLSILPQDMEIWRTIGPACDIEMELKKAAVWVRDNPQKGVKKNYRKFLSNWISRAQERGGGITSNLPRQEKPRFNRDYGEVLTMKVT